MTCATRQYQGGVQPLGTLALVIGAYQPWNDVEVSVFQRYDRYVVCVSALDFADGGPGKTRYCWHSLEFPTREDAEAWVATTQLTAALS